VVETQPPTIAEFGSPQTGPQRGTKAGPSWLLRSRPSCAQARSSSAQGLTASAQGKAATAQGGGPNWSWGKKSYVRLLGYFYSFLQLPSKLTLIDIRCPQLQLSGWNNGDKYAFRSTLYLTGKWYLVTVVTRARRLQSSIH
jgi:hypothetical protein